MSKGRMLYWWRGVIGFLSFFALGLIFFRYAGFQNDELLFAGTVFRRSASVYILPVGRGLPLMALSYLGTLKSWVWGPLLRYNVSEASVRLPAVFLGALTVLITYQLVARMHSRRAAMVATAILATDASFFLTTCFDWGPVAFQHVFVVTGLLLVLRFAENGRLWALFFAFLAFGLGLWDKALFLWIFSALAVAAVLCYPRELLKRLSARNLGVAALGILVGASPLIVYNVAKPLETFRSSGHFVFNDFRSKWWMVRITLGGAALEGYLTSLDKPPVPGGPSNVVERSSFTLRALTGARPAGYQEEAILGALLLLPFLLAKRVHRMTGRCLLFLLVAFLVGWFQMAITQVAGGAVHHVILLWPLPAIFLGIALAQASSVFGRTGTALLALATLAIAGSNLTALNEYLYTFIESGAGPTWTDAIGPLVKKIAGAKPTRVVVYDWGISTPLEVMTKERILPEWADDPMFAPAMSEKDRKFRMTKLEDPGAIWVGHTDGYEQFAGINARIVADAGAVGFEKEALFEVSDSHGRPTFQVFRWRRVEQTAGGKF